MKNSGGIFVPNTEKIWTPRQRGREMEKDYNEINVEDSYSVNEAKLESWIAKKLGTVLMKEYPDREWAVRVNIPGQIVEIMCHALSGTHAYHIKMGQRTIHDLEEKSIKAGGEILERHGVTRGKKYDTDITENFERDLKGDVIGGDNS